MAGFYSKDLILESAYGQFYFSSTVIYFIATIAAIFTSLYSIKVLYLTFLSNPHGSLINYKQAITEGDIFMCLPAKWCGKSLTWVKLSNSGEVLKLLVPSYSWKAISGWINYSCMVISQKISEKRMDNRGSKSGFVLRPVKEQRVDGSWYIKLMISKVYSNRFLIKPLNQNPGTLSVSHGILMCKLITNKLIGFKSNFTISRGISRRLPDLHPYCVTGFFFFLL